MMRSDNPARCSIKLLSPAWRGRGWERGLRRLFAPPRRCRRLIHAHRRGVDNDAVIARGGCKRDEAVEHVIEDGVRVPCEGVEKAAAAGELQGEPIVRAKQDLR